MLRDRFSRAFEDNCAQGRFVIFAPASSPEEADYLWKTRLRGRAVDNQLFMVGVNRWGDIGNEIYLGKSLVISPLVESYTKARIKKRFHLLR
jgi:predicted amidohydrolase